MSKKVGTMMRKILIFLVLTVFCLSLSGCGSSNTSGNEAEGNVLQDSLGREIILDKIPEKIISLSPATTEIIFALGLGDKVVGNTDYCDYPEEANTKDKIGGFENPNLELILSKEPDIVFTAAGIQEEVIKKLEEVNITVVCLDAETIEQVMDNILLVGKITGTDSQAEEIVNDIKERMDIVIQAVKGKPMPSVFFEVWDDPLMTAGSGSFIDSLINLAGGKNVASEMTEKYANYSLEKLLEADPDYYLLNNHAHRPEEVKERNSFKELKAVQENRVFAIEDDLVTLPGPRIIEGLEEIARIIHPEVFSQK